MICDRCGSEVATHGKCFHCAYRDPPLRQYQEPLPDYEERRAAYEKKFSDEHWQVWHPGLGRWVLSEALTQYQAEEHARALVHKHGGEGRCRKLVPGAPIPVEGPHVHSWHNNLGYWFCVDCGERKRNE